MEEKKTESELKTRIRAQGEKEREIREKEGRER